MILFDSSMSYHSTAKVQIIFQTDMIQITDFTNLDNKNGYLAKMMIYKIAFLAYTKSHKQTLRCKDNEGYIIKP